jgi:hypothetical protein
MVTKNYGSAIVQVLISNQVWKQSLVWVWLISAKNSGSSSDDLNKRDLGHAYMIHVRYRVYKLVGQDSTRPVQLKMEHFMYYQASDQLSMLQTRRIIIVTNWWMKIWLLLSCYVLYMFCCYPSGQAWECNFIKGEKADSSIIHMTIFQRDASEIIFHCFQFNLWGWFTPALDWKNNTSMSYGIICRIEVVIETCINRV